MVKSSDLVNVSREIKQRFHRFGIHSSTIQPEIVASSATAEGLSHISEAAAAERGLETEGCPVLCAEGAACADNQCCPPAEGSRAGSISGAASTRASSPH